MRILHINVLDKKATYLSRDGDIVCGNSNYLIEFAFDAEWDGYYEKTARFIWNGKYQDVKFAGTACYAPIVTNTTELKVGVYAGELSTTTSATIPCNKSILCESSTQGGSIIINGGEGGGSGSDVPIPTPNDNGKVLTAEDCKVIWKEPTGGNGGGGDTSALQEQINELRAEMETEDLCTTVAVLTAQAAINETAVSIQLYASRTTQRGEYDISNLPSFLKFLTQDTGARAKILLFIDSTVYHALAPNMYRDADGAYHIQFLFQMPGATEITYHDVSVAHWDCHYTVNQKELFTPNDFPVYA